MSCIPGRRPPPSPSPARRRRPPPPSPARRRRPPPVAALHRRPPLRVGDGLPCEAHIEARIPASSSPARPASPPPWPRPARPPPWTRPRAIADLRGSSGPSFHLRQPSTSTASEIDGGHGEVAAGRVAKPFGGGLAPERLDASGGLLVPMEEGGLATRTPWMRSPTSASSARTPPAPTTAAGAPSSTTAGAAGPSSVPTPCLLLLPLPWTRSDGGGRGTRAMLP